jgi:hypothetical protein
VAAPTRTLSPKGYGNTSRTDSWVVAPTVQALGFLAAIVYSTWAAFQGDHYLHEPYLSPFYSPTVIVDLNFWPFTGPLSFLSPLIHPISPALIILIFPLGFRLTCYYYRKMYYRAFFGEPTACAVGERGSEESYAGETRFPFVLVNVHRWFLYAATVILFVLVYDLILAFSFAGGTGVGLGTVVLAVNVVFLALFTFSCNSFRHLVGGNVDCFSCAKFGLTRYKTWKAVSVINKHHMAFAWLSLGTVCFADFYVRLVAGGIPYMSFTDPYVLLDPAWIVAGVLVMAAATVAYVLKMGKFAVPGTA